MVLGAIQPQTQQIQTQSSQSAPSAPTYVPDVNQGAGNYAETVKKYAPYVIGAILLYLLLRKK
jgi:hypothetical protein